MADELIVVYEAPNQFHSEMVRDTLQQAGIPVLEQVDRSWTAYDAMEFSMMEARYSRLSVPEAQVDEARHVIADFLAAYERGDLAVSEDEMVGDGEAELQ